MISSTPSSLSKHIAATLIIAPNMHCSSLTVYTVLSRRQRLGNVGHDRRVHAIRLCYPLAVLVHERARRLVDTMCFLSRSTYISTQTAYLNRRTRGGETYLCLRRLAHVELVSVDVGVLGGHPGSNVNLRSFSFQVYAVCIYSSAFAGASPE